VGSVTGSEKKAAILTCDLNALDEKVEHLRELLRKAVTAIKKSSPFVDRGFYVERLDEELILDIENELAGTTNDEGDGSGSVDDLP
jgi:hypothetical protein